MRILAQSSEVRLAGRGLAPSLDGWSSRAVGSGGGGGSLGGGGDDGDELCHELGLCLRWNQGKGQDQGQG